ncbi:Dolichyl-diphosphooligosaccharide--protein glycosyltransferase subunit Swp1 [Mrakia frigida]|uniref:Dolichyl-diphosphooligosaccharide--protein glycosyltransferase subunit Swp1 n=1 Tax=Mrakia frigida TaxID=29902 RepID=UPI003FCBFC8A
MLFFKSLPLLVSSSLLAATATLAASPSSLLLKTPVITVTSSEGSTLASHQLEPPASLSSPITLPPLSTFKLAFQLVDEETGDGVVPHQAHLSFVDVETGKDAVIPLNVRANGRARFEIDTASPPSVLLPTSGSFALTLNIGSLSAPKPISYPLLTLTLPSALLHPIPSTQGPTDHISGSFAKQPTIEHTFRADEKGVNPVVSLVATAGALGASWVVLVSLISNLNLQYTSKAVSIPFLATLVALESTIGVYWIGYIKLFKFLAIFSFIGVASFFTGRQALRRGGVPN